MHLRYGRCFVSSLALSLLVMVACSQPARPQPTSFPNDTSTAISQSSFPEEDQKAIDAFVRRRQVVDGEWLQIRDDFDQWSTGLTACQPNSMREALNEFATGFSAITEQARGLTRAQATGGLADILITAAEEEEKAFRHLRDRWQPGDTALFERIDEQQAQASRAQRDAEDRVIALRQVIDEVPDPETRETFPRSLELILNDWKSVHDEYAKLRTVAESRETVDVASGFARLAEELTSVIDALGELPHRVWC